MRSDLLPRGRQSQQSLQTEVGDPESGGSKVPLLSGNGVDGNGKLEQDGIRGDGLQLRGAAEQLRSGEGSSSSLHTQVVWLLLWVANNVGVTLLNKAAFAGKGGAAFHYPYTLSAIHMAINWAGSSLTLSWLGQEKKTIARRKYSTVLIFSIIFSLNIAIGNLSLRYVSVNFNQVMRSLVPGVVMAMGMLFFGKSFSARKRLSVIPIMLGVALACFGDMSYTSLGLVTTVLCVILAALKVVLSGELLTGEMKLPPLNLLAIMTPLALIQTGTMAVVFGEVSDIFLRWTEIKESGAWLVVIFSGLLSFSLNITSFQANKWTSPLTLSIAANVKQALLIAVSTIIFNTHVTLLNALGIVIVILGSTKYSMVSLEERSL